jgi:hypothetical protein
MGAMLNRELHTGTEKGALWLPFLRGNQPGRLSQVATEEAWTVIDAARRALVAKII